MTTRRGWLIYWLRWRKVHDLRIRHQIFIKSDFKCGNTFAFYNTCGKRVPCIDYAAKEVVFCFLRWKPLARNLIAIPFCYSWLGECKIIIDVNVDKTFEHLRLLLNHFLFDVLENWIDEVLEVSPRMAYIAIYESFLSLYAILSLVYRCPFSNTGKKTGHSIWGSILMGYKWIPE